MSTNTATREYDIFSARTEPPTEGTTVRGVRQDKGVHAFDRVARAQPLSFIKDTRLKDSSTHTSRSRKSSKDRLVPLTLQVRSQVKSEVERLAESLSSKTQHISVSKVGGTLLEDAIRRDIHSQQEALLYPVIRQVMRDELRVFGNRIIFFLMRIAFASEHSRILLTNILNRLLRKDGVPEETMTNLIDQSSRMARRNIIQKTPLMKTLLDEWEASVSETKEEGGGT